MFPKFIIAVIKMMDVLEEPVIEWLNVLKYSVDLWTIFLFLLI